MQGCIFLFRYVRLFFFPKKYKCMIIRVCTINSFFAKSTGVRFWYVHFFFFYQFSTMYYEKGMYIYFISPIFPPCTIKRVCMVNFPLIFQYVRLSKWYVQLLFLPKFPVCTVIWVCTVIVFSITIQYVRLFGYARLLFFPKQSTMYGYSGMYLYSEHHSIR